MQEKSKLTKKSQTIIGISLVVIFIVSASVVSDPGLSLIRTAAAGYGSDNGGHHRSEASRRREERERNAKRRHRHDHDSNKNTSQSIVRQKIAEFEIFNNARSIADFNKIAAIKKNNPARFRALEAVFKKYNTVGGSLKVNLNPQTISAINMFRAFDGYSTYLKYVGRLNK